MTRTVHWPRAAFSALARDEAATLAEYALMIALIALIALLAVSSLGDRVANGYAAVANELTAGGSGGPGKACGASGAAGTMNPNC